MAEACDVACDTTSPPPVGRLGRRPWADSGTIEANNRHRRRHLQCRRFAAGLDRLVDAQRPRRRSRRATPAARNGSRASTARAPSRQLPGRPLWRLRPGPGLCRRHRGLRLQLQPDVAGPSPCPACSRAPPRAAPGPTSSTASSRPATASTRRPGRCLCHAVRSVPGLHRHAERLHRERRAVARPDDGVCRPLPPCARCWARRSGGAMDFGWRKKLAMQFRLGWSHEYADTARPVTASFAGAPVAALHDLRRGAATRRRGAGAERRHRGCRSHQPLPALRGRYLRPGQRACAHRRRAHDVVTLLR